LAIRFGPPGDVALRRAIERAATGRGLSTARVNNTWIPRGRRLLGERLGVGARTECGYFRAKDTLLDVSIDATGAGLAVPALPGLERQGCVS
jgi:hypothetical protein